MATRAGYITDDEKTRLIELVNKYRGTIENKRTDAVSLNAKASAWEHLAIEFSSMEGVRPRDVKQLKKAWDNLKTKWKKQKARETRHRMITGTYMCYASACPCAAWCGQQCSIHERRPKSSVHAVGATYAAIWHCFCRRRATSTRHG